MRRVLLLVLALALLATTAVADPRGVHTDREGARVLPLPKEEGAFHFLIFGDRTGSPASSIDVLTQAVRDTNLLDPDLVLTVGDLINGYNGAEAWKAQTEEFLGVMNGLEMPWFPVPGNHDIYWGGRQKAPPGHHEKDYEQHFGPLWYWFGHKNAAFVVLYSDEGERATNRKGWHGSRVNRFSDAQLAWLATALAEMEPYDHVFLFLHHPRWITDYYAGSNWDAVHRLLVEAGNVSGVFGGHIHRQRYEGIQDGIGYYALGTTGGAIPYSVPGTGFLHHMDLVTVRKDGFKVGSIPVGAVADPREMTPERLREIDAVRTLAPAFETPPLDIHGTGIARGVCSLRLENPTTHPLHVTTEIRAKDRGWWFAPSHAHVEIAPGEAASLSFRYGRDAQDELDGLALPILGLQVDYLAPTSRVSLPEREIGVPWQISGLPEDVLADVTDRSLSLDGKGCLSVPARRLDVPDGPFTVEGWLNADSFAGRRGFLSKAESSDYGLFVSDARPLFAVWLGDAYATAGVQQPLLEVGRWHHVAGVFDGEEVRLYVDGKRVATARGKGARRRNRWPLYIGADPDRSGLPVSGFDGRIDEVRVSRVARYAGEAFEPGRRFTTDEDTLLLLHLDGGLGPVAVDRSAAARHALPVGPVEYAAP